MKDLILKNRSCRRFHQEVTVDSETLRELVDLARLSASANNKQPLKYILSCEPEKSDSILRYIRFGVFDDGKPPEGERPSAYIIILGDTDIMEKFGCDHGIAAQSIMLGATARGLGGCIIAWIDKEGLSKALDISDRYKILLVLALGKPKQKAVIEEVGSDGNTSYWQDNEGIHHVPKRALDDIIIG